MSILKVDTINEKTSGNGVAIPDHVIQTVHVQHFNTGTGNSGGLVLSAGAAFVDVFSQAITTKATNSKILLVVSCTAFSTSNLRGQSRIMRGATELYRDPYAWYTAASNMYTHSLSHLDSPSVVAGTTITYQFQGSAPSADLTVKYADGGGTTHNSFTIMEIAQ